MASFSAPTVSHPKPPVTRRHRALLAAVAAGRCHLSSGPLPSLLIDRRGACDQLAAYQLLANGLIRPGSSRDDGLVAAELTPAGEAAMHVDARG